MRPNRHSQKRTKKNTITGTSSFTAAPAMTGPNQREADAAVAACASLLWRKVCIPRGGFDCLVCFPNRAKNRGTGCLWCVNRQLQISTCWFFKNADEADCWAQATLFGVSRGGFTKFQTECPQHCETNLDDGSSASSSPLPPVLGIGDLCIHSDCSDAESDPDRDQLSGMESEGASPPGPTSSFPVQILPHLYLGSATDSGNMDILAKLGIRYILNVTPNLPNLFEENGDFRYKQIPISDHWSQNLSQFFPEAIEFIDEALSQNCGVLVHCLAGISRSVTVTVAYLMQKLNLSLNDAYDLVKRKKSNISPNFNFLGQLMDFEKSLGRGSSDCDSQPAQEQAFFTTTTTDDSVFQLDST